MHAFASALITATHQAGADTHRTEHLLLNPADTCDPVRAHRLSTMYALLSVSPLDGSAPDLGCFAGAPGFEVANLLGVIFQLVSVVLLLNMLIAKMAKTFDMVWESQQPEYHLGFACVVLSMELAPIYRLPPFSLLAVPYDLMRLAGWLLALAAKLAVRAAEAIADAHHRRRRINPHAPGVQRWKAAIGRVMALSVYHRLVSAGRDERQDGLAAASVSHEHSASRQRVLLIEKLSATARVDVGGLRSSAALRKRLGAEGLAPDLVLNDEAPIIRHLRTSAGYAELTREIVDYVDARAGDMVEEDDKPKRDLKRFQGDMRKRLEGIKAENLELRQALVKMDRKLDAMSVAVGAQRVASPVHPVGGSGQTPQRSPAPSLAPSSAPSPRPDPSEASSPAPEDEEKDEADSRFAA